MIKTELTFFDVQVKRRTVETAKLGQAHLGDTPEVLNAVDVSLVFHKLVATVIDPVVLLVAQVHQAAVAFPAIRIDDAAQGYLALQNGRQHSAAAIGHDLRVNFPLPLEQAEDRHFLKGAVLDNVKMCYQRRHEEESIKFKEAGQAH